MTLAWVALAREGVDRSALRRTDGAWLDAAWADPRTRVLAVADGRVPVDSDGSDAPRLLLCSPADAPPGERRLLGADADGVAYFSVDVPAPQALTGTTAGVREVGALLDNRDAGLLVQAVALANWHSVHTHCARCGTPTEVTAAGHVRQCPADGSQHFPRTDPAVIMPVVDAADRLLLARGATWPLGRMSTVAGFVEPGESLEQAVRREVREEVGIEIGAVDYLGSQPWPFPSSLMVGFIAHAETTDITVDGAEIAEARWFTRDQLVEAIGRGQLRIAPRVSIARVLIEHWFGAEIPDGPPP